MTKSAKKKKEKASDFTKRKLKLGKGKQPATNAVDTSFKARSIALPQQSIANTNVTSAPTTKRKLTLDALLTHLKHYSAGVRKDALQGLQELLNEHPGLVGQNLSRLVTGCVRLITDEDATVRKALHSFLAWLLPRTPRDHLLPHASTLLLFTSSAQSHIFLEIRIDAIRILDLLLEYVPEQVVTGLWSHDSGGNRIGHGRKLLDGYLGLLNVGKRFSEEERRDAGPSSGIGGHLMTSATLSPTAKASVLKSFSKFLRCAIELSSQEGPARVRQSEESIPLWYLSKAFKSHEAFTSFTNMLCLQRTVAHSQVQARLWSENGENDHFTGSFTLSGISDKSIPGADLLDVEEILSEIECLARDEKSREDLDSLDGRLLISLYRALHTVLLSTFLDCAPSVFSPTQASPETELELIHAVMEISSCVYGRLLREADAWDQKQAARKDLEALVMHMSTYFPFGENRMIALDTLTNDAFQQMNLIYCELFSLRTVTSITGAQEDAQIPVTKRRKLKHSDSSMADLATATGMAKQTERVREYILQSLRGTASGASATALPLGRQLTAQTYVGLLPMLWWLLNDQGSDNVSEVLIAVLQHATKVGSTSGVKPSVTEFVGRLALLHTEPLYKGSFKIGPFSPNDLQEAFRDWLYHLPKVLWELGDRNTTATELILLLILRLLQRRSWLNNIETFIALCTRFAPFFTVQHATRGELRGPYLGLNAKSFGQRAVSCVAADPNNSGKISPLQKLALDVAATLVSTTEDSFRPAPRKISSLAGRRAGDYGRITGLGCDPVSAMGLTESSVAKAQASLRKAVDNAVSGTAEEAYWRGVSKL